MSQKIMPENKEKEPSKSEVDSLLQYYKDRNYKAAEELAVSIIENFPNNQLSWKVLGSVLKIKGELSRSLEANKKVVEINPDDPDGYNNLGNTLIKLGRSNEAEQSFKRAIAINPDHHEYHCNL